MGAERRGMYRGFDASVFSMDTKNMSTTISDRNRQVKKVHTLPPPHLESKLYRGVEGIKVNEEGLKRRTRAWTNA